MNESASQTESINICGILVHAHPENTAQVQQTLATFTGVEIHEVTADGRLIITIDHPDRRTMTDTINRINGAEGVLSAAMVYQHHE